MKDLNAALISSIGFLLLCVATGVTYCVVEFRRLFPAKPAPTPESVEPHWADLVVPLDRIETVDDILAELETPVPPAPPIIPGRTRPQLPAWTADQSSWRLEFLDIAEELEDVQELLTQIVDAHLYPANAEETSQ